MVLRYTSGIGTDTRPLLSLLMRQCSGRLAQRRRHSVMVYSDDVVAVIAGLLKNLYVVDVKPWMVHGGRM